MHWMMKILAWTAGAAIVLAAVGLIAASYQDGQDQDQPPPAQSSEDQPPAKDKPGEAQAESEKTEEKAEEELQPYQHATPPASSERIKERKAMVERQIAAPHYGSTPVKDEKVLQAMRTAPRHVFIPRENRSRAYADTPLPIGYGQTISQPYMVAMMTELLKLEPDSKVLEIGTGSGYQAAVLAHLTPHVYTIEIIKPLAERAEKALREQGYKEVHCRRADGYHGWAEEGPFDAIIVTCAAGHLPPPLWDQLKPGGRIVIPIGGQYEVQRLVVVTKQEDGSRKSETIMAVRFVPLTREDKP